MSVGILAYGSLMSEPGMEIEAVIARRIPTITPFAVEYARLSGTRGGAPTVVPHSSGKPVKGEVLVLSDAVSVEEAKSLLWRREARKERSGRTYHESTLANAIVVRDEPRCCGLDHVLYTDFNAGGKLTNPDPRMLAQAAIDSVAKAPPGKDGISYLMDLLDRGIETALTPQYVHHILAIAGAPTLAAALDSVRDEVSRRLRESVESLLAYCRENSRLCPTMPQWDKLWKGLPNRTRIGGQWQPPPPLDFPGAPTPGILRMISLTEHIEWAAKHGALESVGSFLRGLREEDWLHLGD